MIISLFFFIFSYFNLIAGLSPSIQLNLDHLGFCSFTRGTVELFELSNTIFLKKNGEYRLKINSHGDEGNQIILTITI